MGSRSQGKFLKPNLILKLFLRILFRDDHVDHDRYVGIELREHKTMHVTSCTSLLVTQFVTYGALHSKVNAMHAR